MQPLNQAAQLIINAQSVIGDLLTQATEIQRAIDRQQTVIDQLMAVAVWEQPTPAPETPEPVEQPAVEETPEPVEIITYPDDYTDEPVTVPGTEPVPEGDPEPEPPADPSPETEEPASPSDGASSIDGDTE